MFISEYLLLFFLLEVLGVWRYETGLLLKGDVSKKMFKMSPINLKWLKEPSDKYGNMRTRANGALYCLWKEYNK